MANTELIGKRNFRERVAANTAFRSFKAADFFATSFACSSALVFFAAWIVSSLAASSASKDVFWKFFGMNEVKRKAAE